MKQSLFRQWSMLAILFFVGIGSAFGKDAPTITLKADASRLNADFYKLVNGSWWYQSPSSTTENQMIWKAPEGTYYLSFSLKNLLTYHISSITSGNNDLMPEYRQKGYITFENITANQEVVVEIEKNEDVPLKTITIDRSNFDSDNGNKCKTIFSYVSNDYERDFTGITEFTGWTQFGDGQEGAVDCTEDGLAITVGSLTGQVWQPQLMVVPDGSFDLQAGQTYKVIVTAKFPTGGTLQINMGSWSANFQNTVDVVSTGDFQDVEVDIDCEYDCEGAHLLFQPGDFLGTTILKKIKVIGDFDAIESEPYVSFDETNEFLSGKTVRMRIEEDAPGWQVSGVKVDGTPVDYTKGYYDFVDDANHTVSVTFSELTTHKISTTINSNAVLYNDQWAYNGDETLFNEGTPVTMSLESFYVYKEWDETIQDYQYGLYGLSSLKIDGNNIDISTLSKSDVGDYGSCLYDFGPLMADHTVEVVYDEVPSYIFTAEYDKGNVYLNDRWLGYGKRKPFASGSSVTMTIVPTFEEQGAKYTLASLLINDNEIAVNNLEKNENGLYVYTFNNLSADVTVGLNYALVQQFTITSNSSEVWIVNSGYNQIDDETFVWTFDEGSDVEMRIPLRTETWNENSQQWEWYMVTFTVDGQAVDADDYTIDDYNNNYLYDDVYVYTFSNISANHVVALAYEKCPTITVNAFALQGNEQSPIQQCGSVLLNNVDYCVGYGDAETFDKGEDVKMILKFTGYEISNITKAVNNGNPVDITEQYNKGYTFENLEGDVVVNVMLNWVGSYYIGTQTNFENLEYFNELSTTYFESSSQERYESTGDRFTKGEDVTLYIKPAIGYEVSSVEVDDDEVNTTYNNETKEWSYVFTNIKSYHRVVITIAKKFHDASKKVTYTMNGNGQSTYCSEYDLDFSGFKKSVLSAYVACGFDPVSGSILLRRVEYAPAGTGLMLIGTPNKKFKIPVTNTNFCYSNMLKGIVVETAVGQTEEDHGITYYNYSLQKHDGDATPLFYLLNGNLNSKVPANRAYLRVPEQYYRERPAEARPRSIGFIFEDGDTNDINDIETNDIETNDIENGDYYNLNGQKVDTLKKGIYIKNGKKVIIR